MNDMGQYMAISEVSRLFFFLRVAYSNNCRFQPQSREVLTICRRSDVMKLETEKACRENITAAGGEFQMLHNFLQDYMVDSIKLCHVLLYWQWSTNKHRKHH